MLEYGRITDSEGVDVNFKNTIVIITSNIGAHRFEKLNGVGFAASNTDTKAGVIDELTKSYAPEFLNRLDEIIVFNKLEDGELMHITTLLMKQLKRNMRKNAKCTLTYGREVVEFLVSKNKDKQYGARPMRRIITEHVETPLADKIIEQEETVKGVHVHVRNQSELFFDVFHNS
jgi:ATP-dependent Clp protease ATP-binding subunit ClpC